MQFGTFSTAYFTVSIAFHTFKSLVLRKRQSALVAGITIAYGWTQSAVLGTKFQWSHFIVLIVFSGRTLLSAQRFSIWLCLWAKLPVLRNKTRLSEDSVLFPLASRA